MVAIISITFIIMSTVVLTLNTLPYFMQKADSAGAEKDYPPFALVSSCRKPFYLFFIFDQNKKARVFVLGKTFSILGGNVMKKFTVVSYAFL